MTVLTMWKDVRETRLKEAPAPIPSHLSGSVRQRRCNIITAGTLLFPMIHLRQSGSRAQPMNGFSVSQG